MNKKIFVLALGATEVLMFFSLANVAKAETIVPEQSVYNDVVWDRAGSPYVLKGDFSVVGGSLTIGPGVEVKASEEVDYTPGIIINGGRLNINGKGSDRVKIGGIYNIYAFNDSVINIKNADLTNQGGISFFQSTGNIATTTISNTFQAIEARQSNIKVWGSKIYDNTFGIIERPVEDPVLMNVNVAVSLAENSPTSSSESVVPDFPIIISGSAIMNSSKYAIQNLSDSNIKAENNWWGSITGANIDSTNKTTGNVDYEPWLQSEPPLDPGNEDVCCSSVLFLPGLEASRLYATESSSTNRLWEPNRNADVASLYLDKYGSTTNSSIYSGKPIDKALGIIGIYGKFMSFMDSLKNEKYINDWLGYGYDWRKSIDQVVMGTEKRIGTTSEDSLLSDLDNLTKTSKTGKVTIVAHSNGGLVAKYLVKTLEEMGKADLIDKVISVGVPYLGTPQSIGAILHGADQSILKGFILKESIARGLAVNMPSVYSLLPSKEYFKYLFYPSIAFASTTIVGLNDGSYSKNINTYNEQMSFISDSKNLRTDSMFEDTSSPIKGNRNLIDIADSIHSMLDAYNWPQSILNFGLVGVGRKTNSGWVYSEEPHCFKSAVGMSCNKHVAYSASTTLFGDGTVIAPSAGYNAGNIISLDLPKVSENDGLNISHANLLESKTIESVIKDLILGNNADNKIAAAGVNTDGLNYSKDNDSFLVVSTHSPVDLDVYDSKGNHTGSISSSLADENLEPGLYSTYEENIPNSSYERTSEPSGDYANYIYLPNSAEKYSVLVNGNGVGSFTLNIDRVNGGTYTDKLEFKDLPVTPFTEASTTIVFDPALNSLASSTDNLKIDIDGDGKTDISSNGNNKFDPIMYLESLKKIVSNLVSNTTKGKNLIKRIDKLELAIMENKTNKVLNMAIKISTVIKHKKFKNINNTDKAEIVDMIDTFISKLE